MGLTVTAVVFLLLAATCAIASSSLIHQEIESVNRKLPEEEQISYSLMYPGKMRKIKAAYRRYYPMGHIEQWRIMLQAGMFVFLALCAIAAGFFR